MADDEDTCGFSINTDYAKKYNTWREKEELQKLKDRFGDAAEEDSSTSESEDEDAEGLTAEVEKDWLRTFAAVKTKNPKIYDKNIQFFTEDEKKDAQKQKVKKNTTKAVYLKDYERQVILEKGGVVSESEDDDFEDDNTHKPGYYEEQEAIKNSISKVVKEEGSDSDDDLLMQRTKTKEDQEKEEQDYVKWLKGQKPNLDEEVKTDLAPLKEVWSDPNLAEGDRFLRDYILNKRYLEDDDDDRIPTYDEITRDADLSDDEKLVDKQETFERKFNFRYEEPDAEFIKAYPRTVGDSIRRPDDRRKKKRAEIKERKEKEKDKKKEELKQLKNMKRREIMSKLEQLKQITGNDTIGISEADIEGDFDPKQYDTLMEKVFSEDYYDDEEGEKPTFPDDEELGFEGENWDGWTGADGEGTPAPVAGSSQDNNNDEGPGCEDPDFNMDCDYDPTDDRSFGLDGRSKKKKKSKFKQALEKKKPQFDPSEKTFEEYLDEYYKLDYEDMIGDLPCRFKYRQVPANDYGLSTDEVLKCDDKELNAWVSLRKMSQYSTEEDEYYDQRLYSKKARNVQKKLNILHSLIESESEADEDKDNSKERYMSKTMKKKNRKKRLREEAEGSGRDFQSQSQTLGQTKKDVVKKDVKGGKSTQRQQNVDNSDNGVAKKKQKLSDDAPSSEAMKVEGKDESADNTVTQTESSKKKKVKKLKTETIKVDNKDESTGDAETQKETIDKKKVKKTKQKKQGAGVMSDERLKAFGINPKKFKYTHLPKLKENRKKERRNQSKGDS